MNAKVLFFAMSTIIVTLFTSCDSDEDEQISYPVEITTTDFNLTEYFIDAQWDYNNSNIKEGVIINSLEELYSYFIAPEVSGKPMKEIDFNKYSIILYSGVSTYGIAEIDKDFYQLSDKKYAFDVNITNNVAAVITLWTVSVIVEKMPQDAEVSFNSN